MEVLRQLARDGRLPAHPQPSEGATYAHRLGRDDARIDWSADAEQIDRQVRAFDPLPGAFTLLRGQSLKVWRAQAAGSEPGAAPGTVLEATARGIVVECGRGRLVIGEVQPAGGRRMNAAAFVAGRGVEAGVRLGGA